ncbi:MAG TPA: hypothetical protein ENJ52_05405 [Aliiroseovarius sp.]|nr:hypothetical protein [Aliiroseovarius sp.]
MRALLSPFLRLAEALIRPQLKLRKAHALRRARLDVTLAVLGGLAGAFTLALITVALVQALGPLWALAIEAGVFALATALVYALMRAEARRQAREAAYLAQVQRQELRAALGDAIPKTGGLGLAAAGLAMGLAYILASRTGDGSGAPDDSDDTPDA